MLLLCTSFLCSWLLTMTNVKLTVLKSGFKIVDICLSPFLSYVCNVLPYRHCLSPVTHQSSHHQSLVAMLLTHHLLERFCATLLDRKCSQLLYCWNTLFMPLEKHVSSFIAFSFSDTSFSISRLWSPRGLKNQLSMHSQH